MEFTSIYGQRVAKRAFEIAMCGKHSIAIIGPPGCGKTLLAETATSIVPDLQVSESRDSRLVDHVYAHIVVVVGPVRLDDLINPRHSESSDDIAVRVEDVNEIQEKRWGSAGSNGTVDHYLFDCNRGIDLNKDARRWFHDTAEKMNISARGWFDALRVACTIADMDDADSIQLAHIEEALSYSRDHLLRNDYSNEETAPALKKSKSKRRRKVVKK